MTDERRCFLCGRNGASDPLERHHIFGGAYETRARNTALWCISAANDATGTVETLYTETGIKCVCFADTAS